jgi:hypothetical protein
MREALGEEKKDSTQRTQRFGHRVRREERRKKKEERKPRAQAGVPVPHRLARN